MLYKIFDIRGTQRQIDLTVESIDNCSFPWDLCVRGLREIHGMSHAPIHWDNNMPTSTVGELKTTLNSAGQVIKGTMRMRMNAKYYDYYGLDPYYLPPYPKRLGRVPDGNDAEGIENEDSEDEEIIDPPGNVWAEKANSYALMRHAVVHEIGHMVDATYLTGVHRRRIYNGFHGRLYEDTPPHGHTAMFKDPAPRDRPDLITARRDDDFITQPAFDDQGDIIAPVTLGGHNQRYNLETGAPIPGVPGRENGLLFVNITDWNDINQWFQPQKDMTLYYPITKKASYLYRVGESFAEQFAKTYADNPVGLVYVHKGGPDMQRLVAKTLTPWMIELYKDEQAEGGGSGQHGPDTPGLPPYVPPSTPGGGTGYIPPGHIYKWPLPPEPMPPSDPIGWQPIPSRGTIEGFYATKKERRYHFEHENYAPEGAIIFPSKEAAADAGKVPCPQCRPDAQDTDVEVS